jgi:hypothetical protein
MASLLSHGLYVLKRSTTFQLRCVHWALTVNSLHRLSDGSVHIKRGLLKH